MIILLIRHGPAGKADPAQWPDDGLRPLTRRGERRTLLAAHGLKRIVPALDVLATSPLTRAVDTARIVAEVYGIRDVQTLEPLAPGGAERRILEFLKRNAASAVVAMVGHEPDLGRLAASLLVGTGALPLKKAGACGLRCDDAIAPAAAELLWWLPPAILRRLGRRAVKV
jgi:phosphohistidine phosphatase